MTFKKTSITANQNRRILSASEDVKISKGVKVSPDAKKSLRKDITTLQEEVTPLQTFMSVFPFISLIGLFSEIKKYFVTKGIRTRYTADMFILWLYVCCFGSKGCTLSKLCTLLYNSDSAPTYRMLLYRLESLCNCGLITYRNVKGKRLYFISIDAENLIHKSVTKKQLREMHNYIKDSIK